MPVTELQAMQGILNVVEGQLAETEELFSQSLQLLSKAINNPSKDVKKACIEFVKQHEKNG